LVNTLSHLGIGLLLASFAGLEGRQKKIVIFLAILPDLDFIGSMMFWLINGSLDHQMHNLLFYLLEHREFMHSILFIFLTILAVYYYERNRKFTLIAGMAIFSHFYLDYATSWKMRPFFPLDSTSSIMGSMDFFDPVVTVISFVPIFFVLWDKFGRKSKEKENISRPFEKKYNRQSRTKLNNIMIMILVLWCILTPLSKAILVNHISEIEGHDISYQNSYPRSTGIFVSAYTYNQTHYKILESSYFSGIKQSAFIPKIKGNEDGNASVYVRRAKELYDTSLPREIDYPVYNVSTNDSSVTVTINDARISYINYWAYFKTDYTFIFNKNNEEYTAYIQRQMGKKELAARNYFE
jgi:inner membrane protein